MNFRNISHKYKTILLCGTRPELIKMYSLVNALRDIPELYPLIYFTGQHDQLLDTVNQDLKITPDFVGSISRPDDLSAFCGILMSQLTCVYHMVQPKAVIVQGDTATTFVGALCAYFNRINTVHIEAGVRSKDLNDPFPEELNRIFTDRVATYLFCPTEIEKKNLELEGITKNVYVTGNTGIDALVHFTQQFQSIKREKGRILVSLHRRESLATELENIYFALLECLKVFKEVNLQVIVHANPYIQRLCHRLLDNKPQITLRDPLTYSQCLQELQTCEAVITDSGGLTEEASALGVPILIARKHHDRPQAELSGIAQKIDFTNIQKSLMEFFLVKDKIARYSFMPTYGDGHSAEHIVEILKEQIK